jgi:hypothetical protein
MYSFLLNPPNQALDVLPPTTTPIHLEQLPIHPLTDDPPDVLRQSFLPFQKSPPDTFERPSASNEGRLLLRSGGRDEGDIVMEEGLDRVECKGMGDGGRNDLEE